MEYHYNQQALRDAVRARAYVENNHRRSDCPSVDVSHSEIYDCRFGLTNMLHLVSLMTKKPKPKIPEWTKQVSKWLQSLRHWRPNNIQHNTKGAWSHREVVQQK